MIIAPGVPAPRQSTSTTCGSACLVVARMLADPDFARWIQAGDSGGRRTLAGRSASDRFAAYERLVKQRTTSAVGLRGLQLPWFGPLGTSPWGALCELAAVAGVGRHDYRTEIVRWGAPADREQTLRGIADAVVPGRPALLYVGSSTLPRHICLLARADLSSEPVLYEPSAGEVRTFAPAALASAPQAVGHQTLGGWPVVWLAVHPR